MKGMQPRKQQKQRRAAHALSIATTLANYSSFSFSLFGKWRKRGGGGGEGKRTYIVLFPLTYSVRVSALCLHAGQSTGAAPSVRFWSGIAVWY